MSILLDSQISQVVGTPIGFTPGQTGGIASVANFLLFLFLVAIVIAAIVRILYALGLRLGSFGDANEAQISASKRIMSTVLISVALSFSLVLISLAVNPDLVRGDVSLLGLRSSGAGAATNTSTNTSNTGQTSTASASCPNTDSYKSTLASGGAICAGTTCSALSGCNLAPYASIIEQESQRQQVDPSLVKAIMCRESKGVPDRAHVNNPPTNVDCGLMQINKPGTTCDASDYDVATNISKGVKLIKQKFDAINQTYPKISKEMMVFASYNCCGTEGSPNEASVDCTTEKGWPYQLPKWACPVNPGPTVTNMCFVRGYVCDIAACTSQLNQ